MDRKPTNKSKENIAALVLLGAVLTSMSPALAQRAPVAVPGAVPITAAPDSEAIPPSPTANANYTPLILAKEAKQRGLNLSGKAILRSTGKQQYKLESGCVLLHTEESVLLKTCRADISIQEGATTVITANKDVTRILNLSDRKRDSIRVLFGQKHISLNPGEELAVVCDKAPDVEKAANEFVIRYRNAQTIVLPPDMKAVLFEFSLADAMKHCLIFKQLKESPAKEDQALLAEIIKTAAAVNTLLVSRGPYSHGTDSATTASIAVAHRQVAIRQKKRQRRLALETVSDSVTSNEI